MSHRNDAETGCERERRLFRQLALRQRTAAGAHHLNVDTRVQNVVEHSGGRGRQADAQCPKHERRGARPAGHGNEHADNRCKHNENNDARFG